MDSSGDPQIAVTLERDSSSVPALMRSAPFGVGRVVNSHTKNGNYSAGALVLARTPSSDVAELIVRERDCIPVPGDLAVDLALWLPPLALGLWVWEKLSLELGEVAVCTEGHPFTDLVAQVALWRGACPLIRIGHDVRDHSIPGMEALSLEDPELAVDTLKKRCQNKPGFAAIDLSGLPEMIDIILDALPRWGRVMLGGPTHGPVTLDFYNNVHYKGAVMLSAVFDPSLVFTEKRELTDHLDRAIRIVQNRNLAHTLLARSGCLL